MRASQMVVIANCLITFLAASFEVEINGVQVFSKLAKNAFPDLAEVVARALDASPRKSGAACKWCREVAWTFAQLCMLPIVQLPFRHLLQWSAMPLAFLNSS
ncbi:hypothetical protein MRX96_021419 [Rhipicephalus microplus]